MYTLKHGKYQPGKDHQRHNIHRKTEYAGDGCDFERKYTLIVNEKLQKNRIIRRVDITTAVCAGFDVSYQNQQEPAKSETHVHISQQRISPEHAPVKKAFHKNFSKCPADSA